MSHAQQVVHDLESLVFGGEVDGGDGADLGEFGSCVVCKFWGQLRLRVWARGEGVRPHLRNEKTGITPDGGM